MILWQITCAFIRILRDGIFHFDSDSLLPRLATLKPFNPRQIFRNANRPAAEVLLLGSLFLCAFASTIESARSEPQETISQALRTLRALEEINQGKSLFCTVRDEVIAGPKLSGNCPYFTGPTQEGLFVPENWGLEATGADLLRSLPELQNLQGNYTVAAIDSGAFLRNNPLAGERLRSSSPEMEWDNHGTHVFGILASEKYGVNPQLRVQMFPTESRPNEGVNTASFVTNLERAAEDPTVKVISISITLSESKVLMAAVKKALDMGKWVVYASGNSGKINDVSVSGQTHFSSHPAFFRIGALNYLSSPASYSNFGPGVSYYAPGSRITSLNGKYNPATGEPAAKVMNGTSMAAPHFSGLLGTMVNLHPKLTIEQANRILSSTAFRRGPAPAKIPVINALRAVVVVLEAKNCLRPNMDQNEENECLAGASQRAQARAREPVGPILDCASEEAFFQKLREGYFLTGGAPEWAERIKSFLKGRNEVSARQFYLSSNTGVEEIRNSLAPLSATEVNRAARELAKAQAFYAGTLPEDLPTGATELNLLLAVPSNVDQFLKHCAKAAASADGPCEKYLQDAPRPFRTLVAEQLVKSVDAIRNTQLVYSLGLFDADSPELYRRLLDLAVDGWEPALGKNTLPLLANLVADMPAETRDRLAEKIYQSWNEGRDLPVRAADKDGNLEAGVTVLSWASDAFLKSRPKIGAGVRNWLVEGTGVPAESELALLLFQATRLRAVPSPENGKDFSRLLKQAMNNPSGEAGHVLARVKDLHPALQSEYVRKEVLDLISSPAGFSKFAVAIGGSEPPFLMSNEHFETLLKVAARDGESSVEKILDSIKNLYEPQFYARSILWQYREAIPAVSRRYDQAISASSKDPALRMALRDLEKAKSEVSVSALTQMATGANARKMSALVNAYPLSLVSKVPVLVAHLQKQAKMLPQASEEERGNFATFLQRVSLMRTPLVRGASEDFAHLSGAVTAALPSLALLQVSREPWFAERLGQVYAELAGDSAKITGEAVTAIQKAQIPAAQGVEQEFLHAISKSTQGRKELEKQSGTLTKIFDWYHRVGPPASGLSPLLLDVAAARIPASKSLAIESAQLPGVYSQLVAERPEHLAWATAVLNDAQASVTLQNDILDAMQRLADRYPVQVTKSLESFSRPEQRQAFLRRLRGVE